MSEDQPQVGDGPRETDELTLEQALARYDAGQPIKSVEMGGLGPGYELAIQTLTWELVRALLAAGWKLPDPVPEKGTEEHAELTRRWHEITEPVIARLDGKPWGGFSGAQVGAASSLANALLGRGYADALATVPAERLIFTSLPPGWDIT